VTSLPCDLYIGDSVFVVYYKDGWQIEETTVSEDPYGIVTVDAILDVSTPYWVGKNFESIIGTLPLVAPNETGKKSRISSISLYVNNSVGGSLVINEGAEIIPFTGYLASGGFTGKVSAPYSGKYEDEPQIEISTNEIYNLRILAIELNRRQYER